MPLLSTYFFILCKIVLTFCRYFTNICFILNKQNYFSFDLITVLSFCASINFVPASQKNTGTILRIIDSFH